MDYNQRLSGTVPTTAVPTPIGQALNATTTAGAYSTNYIDLDAAGTLRTQRDLRDLYALVWFTTTPASATLNATMDIELVQCLTTTPATTTFTTNADTAPVVATDAFTKTAHGLINGTRVTVASSGAFPTTVPQIAASVSYFVVQATTDTFKLSLTPGGAAIDITVVAAGGITLTWTWYHEIVASAPKIALPRLVANVAQVQIPIAPLILGPGNGVAVPRYLFARYLPSATLSSVDYPVFCDIRAGAPMRNFPINANNYVTP